VTVAIVWDDLGLGVIQHTSEELACKPGPPEQCLRHHEQLVVELQHLLRHRRPAAALLAAACLRACRRSLRCLFLLYIYDVLRLGWPRTCTQNGTRDMSRVTAAIFGRKP
jgi:hypothetical protein